MVSKNNMMLLENKQNRKNMRYGIRKFSSGTASVLLGFTVAGTVMMMANHEEASADTVGTQSNTNSVSSTTQNTSVPIQSPKSQDVQNAVNNAVKQGVQVTQNNSQTIVAHNTTEVQKAQQQVSQANQQQADRINGVAQQQKQLNDQYAREKAAYDAWQANTKDSTTVNKQNSDKLQAAVQAAKAAGVQVTQNQTQTKTATSSTYNSVKQDVNNKYNQQVSSLKSITDAQKDLNNRYNSAKADAQNLNSDSNSTRNSLDSAIRNAKSANGVKLIDDGTRNVTVDVNNYNSKKAEIERDNRQQTDSINSQVQQYKSDLQNYLNKINNNSSVVSSNEIIQNLTLANEWDAKVSYQVTGNNIKQSSQTIKTGDSTYSHVIDIPQGKQITVTSFSSDNPQTFKVTATFTGLKNSSYQGRKITKLVEVYTITPNTSARGNAVAIYSDPTNGFSEFSSKVNVSYEFYYEDGSKVNFEKGTAYLALGSLNNYQNGQDHYEYAKVISGGKALGLAGSSVSVHNGNVLYSTYPNPARESEYGADSHYNTNPQHSPNFDKYYGWDTGWLNSKAFYGSGLVSLEGSKYTFEVGVGGEKHFTTDELRNDLPANFLWYNMATVIPRTDIQKPKLTVHYHHTNVALQH